MDGHPYPGSGGASDFHLVPTGCKENTPGDRTTEVTGVIHFKAIRLVEVVNFHLIR